MYNIDINTKNAIIKAINGIITRYLREGLELPDIKKYFKTKTIFNNLLKDINYSGRKNFDNINDYNKYVKEVLNEVLLDRQSDIENKKLSEKKISKYSEYLNENVNFDGITTEYLFSDIEHSKEETDVLSNFFNIKQEYIKNKNSKYSTYTITNFQTDVSNNNRTTFDVLILSDNQIKKMGSNILRKMNSDILSQIPNEINYMGLDIKLHALVDSEKLKKTIEKLITPSNTLGLISNLSKYEYQEQYGDYHIWKKSK